METSKELWVYTVTLWGREQERTSWTFEKSSPVPTSHSMDRLLRNTQAGETNAHNAAPMAAEGGSNSVHQGGQGPVHLSFPCFTSSAHSTGELQVAN